jgi:hypothetical protein
VKDGRDQGQMNGLFDGLFNHGNESSMPELDDSFDGSGLWIGPMSLRLRGLEKDERRECPWP